MEREEQIAEILAVNMTMPKAAHLSAHMDKSSIAYQ